MKGKQCFVCRRGWASFVDIETVIPEKDFDQDPEKYTTSPDRDETMSRSMDYDTGRLSGRIILKRSRLCLFVKGLLL